MVILSLVNYRSYVFIFSQVIFGIFLYKLRLERRIEKFTKGLSRRHGSRLNGNKNKNELKSKK